MEPLPALGVALVLLILNGFFVAVEFALLASRRARLDRLVEQGDARARRASRSLGELTVMLAGAQLGITICSFGIGALAEPALAGGVARVLHRPIHVPENVAHVIAFAIALGIVVFVHMVVGEMAPKSWAITHPERSALILITPFRAFTFVFRPLLVGLNSIANGIIRLFGIRPKGEVSMALSSAELNVLLQRSRDHGTLDMSTHALLTRSLHLAETIAQDAFTPRSQVVFVDAADGVDVLEARARTTRRSRLLVVDGDLDNIVGVLLVRDLLQLTDAERISTTARHLARSVAGHRHDEQLEDILLDMRATRQQLVVVVDDLGHTMGVLSLQDILDRLMIDATAN